MAKQGREAEGGTQGNRTATHQPAVRPTPTLGPGVIGAQNLGREGWAAPGWDVVVSTAAEQRTPPPHRMAAGGDAQTLILILTLAGWHCIVMGPGETQTRLAGTSENDQGWRMSLTLSAGTASVTRIYPTWPPASFPQCPRQGGGLASADPLPTPEDGYAWS